MNQIEETPRQANNRKFKAIMHMAMGVIYLGLGGVILYYRSFGGIVLDPPLLAYALGGLIILYGGFRIWRGFNSLRPPHTFHEY